MNNSITIRVCMGTGGVAAGGSDVLKAFELLMGQKNIRAAVRKECSSHKVGCRGLCAKDVLVDVIFDNCTFTYWHVNPEMVERIVNEHIVGGVPIAEWLVTKDYHKFLEKQIKVVLSDCGNIDPEDIDAYISKGGYEAARTILSSWTTGDVIEEIKESGLRGRGGAGFPTGLKLELAKKAKSDIKYFICNADEGDPGAFMDRAVIEGNPHSVIEGMIICAYAVGAHKGYVYIRAEYPLAVERLELALKQASSMRLLGENIFGSDFSFDVEIKLGAGAFVCGEETALIASIEGQRGMPRARPPFPINKGLWQKPTVINNVETLANIPYIMKKGAEWFSSYGTEKSKGTKVFALTGKIKNAGLIEVPMGITLKEIIYDVGGGIESGKSAKAVQTGGPSGGCIPASMFDLHVDYESLAKVGSIVGSGGMIVLDEDNCMVNMAKYFIQFTQTESCGKCVACRIGTKRLLETLERITKGNGEDGDIPLLQKLSNLVKATSLCGLGKTAPNPVLSTIQYFREEYEAHIKDKKCPSKVCKELLTYFIIEESCTGCGTCLRACPAKVITGEKKKLHAIDQSLCIKCGTCFEVCKFKAVGRV